MLIRHTFCYTCIKPWFVKHSLCPECRSEVNKLELKKDLIPKKIIDDYEVYCIHSECEWIGKLGSLNFHLKKCECETKKKIKVAEEFSSKDCIVLVDDENKEIINVDDIDRIERSSSDNDEVSLTYTSVDNEEQHGLMCTLGFNSNNLLRIVLNPRDFLRFSNV